MSFKCAPIMWSAKLGSVVLLITSHLTSLTQYMYLRFYEKSFGNISAVKNASGSTQSGGERPICAVTDENRGAWY